MADKFMNCLIYQGAVLNLTGAQCPASELWDRWARKLWWSTTTLRQSAPTLMSVIAFTLRSWPWNASWTLPSKRLGHTHTNMPCDLTNKMYKRPTVYSSLFFCHSTPTCSILVWVAGSIPACTGREAGLDRSPIYLISGYIHDNNNLYWKILDCNQLP